MRIIDEQMVVVPVSSLIPFFIKHMENSKDISNINKFLRYGAMAAGGFLLGRAVVKAVRRFKVKNKVILITGSSRGLGLVLARQLADKKAKVVICARNEEELKRAKDDLQQRTKHVMAIPCDLTDKTQVRSLVEVVEREWGAIDVLINNAGIVQVGPEELMKEEDYEAAMKIHFWAPFYAIKEVLPIMQRRREGRIVNIVSIGGKISFPHLLPYNASKFALSGLSEGLTAELAKNNIKVTTVYPGLMTTGSPRNIDVKGQTEKEYAWFKLSDSLPVISMNAERAARKIIKAMREGEMTLTLTLPAKLAEAVHGIAPGLNITIFDVINRMLPSKDGASGERKKGYESESGMSSSFFAKSTEEAGVRNNER